MLTVIGAIKNYPECLTMDQEKQLLANLPNDTVLDYSFTLNILLLKCENEKYVNWTFQGFECWDRHRELGKLIRSEPYHVKVS